MSIKILLADDSITIQKVIGIIFGGEDYSLTVVDNGMNAIAKARELIPDILLIDAIMPGMSGYEVCEAIRAIPALGTKPILLLIGSFEPFDEEKAKSCGADDFIAKPFESQQIISKVKELYESGVARASHAPAIAPTPEQPAPAAVPSVETPPAAPPADDIWGAFTTPVDPEPAAEPTPECIADNVMESDVFAIINEVPDNAFESSALSATSSPAETAGLQWSEIGGQSFGFEDDLLAELSPSASSEPVPAFDATAFDFSYTENSQTTTEPDMPSADFASTPLDDGLTAFEEATVPVTAAPITATVTGQDTPVETVRAEPAATITIPTPSETVPVPLPLTEEQLKAAIAGVSREVIERIVWEIVPDLAESLIKDAIRKIKEGQ